MVENSVAPEEGAHAADRLEDEAQPLLTGSELLLLQLLVLGYTPSQIASLLGVEQRQVLQAAASASAQVGAPDWRAAALLLRRRGLLSAR